MCSKFESYYGYNNYFKRVVYDSSENVKGANFYFYVRHLE